MTTAEISVTSLESKEIGQLSLSLIKIFSTFNGHIALEKGSLLTRLQKKIAS